MSLHLSAASLKLLAPPSTGRLLPSRRLFSSSFKYEVSTAVENRVMTLKNGNDALDINRVVNGLWQTSGGWGRIDRDDAVDAMLRYSDAGLSTFDLADHCKTYPISLDFETQDGPAEDLYGIFINRVRRERPPEYLEKMVDAWRGWSLFQTLIKALKTVAVKHGVSIPTVAVRYILDQPSVAGSMVEVRLGLSEHIQDCNAFFSLTLDEEDVNSIQAVTKQEKDLMGIIGDCGDEYRRA